MTRSPGETQQMAYSVKFHIHCPSPVSKYGWPDMLWVKVLLFFSTFSNGKNDVVHHYIPKVWWKPYFVPAVSHGIYSTTGGCLNKLSGNNNVPRLCHATSHSKSQDCLATWQPLRLETGTISRVLYCLQREASVSATQWIQSLERPQLRLAVVLRLFVRSKCSKSVAQPLGSEEFGHQHTCPMGLSGTTFRNVSAFVARVVMDERKQNNLYEFRNRAQGK